MVKAGCSDMLAKDGLEARWRYVIVDARRGGGRTVGKGEGGKRGDGQRVEARAKTTSQRSAPETASEVGSRESARSKAEGEKKWRKQRKGVIIKPRKAPTHTLRSRNRKGTDDSVLLFFC